MNNHHKPFTRAIRTGISAALVVGLGIVPSLAGATPPGKAPWRYGSGFDPVREANTGLQTQVDRDRAQDLCERDVQSGRTQPGSCPMAAPAGEQPSTTASRSATTGTSASTSANTNVATNATSRGRQRVLPRTLPPGTARGGGPRHCDGADRSTNGHCAAPDLAPVAPQQQWDRDPRTQPMLQQNAPGPSVTPGDTSAAPTTPQVNGTDSEIR